MSLVVFVLIDGLRPDAMASADCPNLKALLERGAYSLAARSVMPSITLPCHMSIFHSVPPERHGVTTNDWQPMARPLPGLMELARSDKRRCAAFYNWEPLRNLSAPGSLDLSYFLDNVYTDLEGDLVIARVAAQHIVEYKPNFVFVYFGTVDTVGHRHGWMSGQYLEQVARADRALGVVLDSLPGDSTVLLQSDHGGHDRNHGTQMPEDMTIPWLVVGPSIRRGYVIPGPVSLLDTAPTLAKLLDLRPHREWEGRCVDEIFVDGNPHEEDKSHVWRTND